MLNAAFAATGIAAEMITVGVAARALRREARRAPRAADARRERDDRRTSSRRTICATSCRPPRARSARSTACSSAGMKIVGHNTDAPGFVDAITAAGIELAGAHVVLLGAGGAARAVAYGCREAGAHVEVVARDSRERRVDDGARRGPALAGLFARAQLVVDCTSAGLGEPMALADVAPLDALARGRDGRDARLSRAHRSARTRERARPFHPRRTRDARSIKARARSRCGPASRHRSTDGRRASSMTRARDPAARPLCERSA